MKHGMQLMADVDVADVVPTPALTEEQNTKPLDFTWVHTWKGMVIRSRLCVRGSKLWIKDLDDTFASTQLLMIRKLFLVFALSMQWRIFTFDIMTAFLYAIRNPDDDPIFVWPPEEHFPNKTLLWQIN